MEKVKKAKVYEQHAENNDFMSRLEFYKDEIAFFEQGLAVVGEKNTDKEQLKLLERFQNQLIIQRNNLDELRHLIHVDEDRLQREVDSNPVAVEHRSIRDHEEEKLQLDDFERTFNSLKEEIKPFISKWM